ncbi:hypothetical protein AVEN_215281-1 [Araneus ventricosus]|uniref:Uncharacterized protein n=1 Tax=Araneus ventricosus TaxID=182803 RepID=A0A4Y2QTK5_ARAVE|nr:hypothetical protein AVEN_215281-1 [Araneus ventricosus]
MLATQIPIFLTHLLQTKGEKITTEIKTIGVLENDLHLTRDDELNDLTPRNKDFCRNVLKTSIVQNGRMRMRNPDAWLCNVRKQKLFAGEEYISKKGKTAAAKNLPKSDVNNENYPDDDNSDSLED